MTVLLDAKPLGELLPPKPDAERAYRVLDLIEKYPEQHDQESWFRSDVHGGKLQYTLDQFTGRCGTMACFAGWAVLEAGYCLDVKPDPYYMVYNYGGELLGGVATVASTLLQLNDEEEDYLFFEISNEELPAAIKEIFGPDPREK